MDLKQYKETTKSNLPPPLLAGQRIASILKVESNTFKLGEENIEGMHVHTAEGVFRTSSGPVMELLKKYFAVNAEPLTNLIVVQKRGKKGTYLTLEGA